MEYACSLAGATKGWVMPSEAAAGATGYACCSTRHGKDHTEPLTTWHTLVRAKYKEREVRV
jgi:hypothetical protein